MSSEYWCGRALEPTFDRKGFISAYKEAFGGPPYYEDYTDQEVVDEVLEPHLRDGLVMYAAKGGKLIGFGCALPFDKSPDEVQKFLMELEESGDMPQEFDYRNSWYMSELGVLNEYRGVGAAWELVMHRMLTLAHRGGDQFFMRTAAIGSMSAPMYARCGATPLLRLQDVSASVQATENHTQSLHRIYLWGNSSDSAAKIRTIKDEKGYPPFASAGELD